RPANREFLAALLGPLGHRVLQAPDGVHGLQLASAERPDVVITDVLMPVMDGYEFARRLRADPFLANTVVIFHTAHYRGDEAKKLAGDCGVTHVMPKPCEPEVVLRTLQQALHAASPPVGPKRQFDGDHLKFVTTKLHEMVKALTRAQGMARLAHVVTGP